MLLGSVLLQQTHATSLVEFLITSYFVNLSSILVVYDAAAPSPLRLEYLHSVEQTLRRNSLQGGYIGLHWLNVAALDGSQLEERILRAADTVIEGFITILPNTSHFLHARYYATRNAALRFKDKFYLFLCEDENPEDFLQLETLQFYPHHLMVTPTSMNVTSKQSGRNPTGMSSIAMKTIASDNKFASAVGGRAPRHQDISFELWTQKFVGRAGNRDAVLLNSFEPNETFASNAELYPNKLSNLEGRTLRVGSITYIPYVVTNYVAAGAGNVDPIRSHEPDRSIFFVGSEANLVHTFCQVYRCHLRVQPYGSDNWGSIYENGSSSGMLGELFGQNVELAIGCIYNWYDNITETSRVIARSAVTLLGPGPALFPAWRTNLMPFTTDLWLLLVATIPACALVMHALRFREFVLRFNSFQVQEHAHFRHYDSFEEGLLTTFAVFLQQSAVGKWLRGFAARFFLATLLMATITLENTYSGQLKSMLTIPFYTEPVDTMQKWTQADWKWGAPSIIWVKALEKSELLMEQTLMEKFETRGHDFLYNASFRHDYGLGVERLMSGTFSFGDYITAPALQTKIVIKDDMYFDWTRAVSIRGWPLMPLFNQHVRACMEAGLFVHWEREIVWQYIDRQVQRILLTLASGNNAKPPPQKLTLENVSGAMFVLLIGNLIAIVVLLLELLTHFVKRKMEGRLEARTHSP